MKFITELLLKLFDFFTHKKIIKTLKQEISNDKKITLFDVGSHRENMLRAYLKILINKAFCFEPNPKVFAI